MDGPYRATLHKLLLYLYPPISLLSKIAEDDNNTTIHKQLLQVIEPLCTHSDVKDDPFRMVHQLDYATSGVLLVGKSKESTAVACKSFEQRKTVKQYVAVITHHSSSKQSDIPPLDSDFINALPVLPTSSLDPWKDGSLEKKYRKKRKRDMNGGSFNGYMPIHSVFDKWRSVLIREKKEAAAAQQDNGKTVNESEQKPNNKKRKKKHNLPPLPSPKVSLSSQDIDELLSLGDSWKTVKSQCSNSKQDWKDIIECLRKDYNKILAEHYAKKKDDNAEEAKEGKSDEEIVAVKQNLPPLFRIESDDKDEFYVCASIGECNDGSFK